MPIDVSWNRRRIALPNHIDAEAFYVPEVRQTWKTVVNQPFGIPRDVDTTANREDPSISGWANWSWNLKKHKILRLRFPTLEKTRGNPPALRMVGEQQLAISYSNGKISD